MRRFILFFTLLYPLMSCAISTQSELATLERNQSNHYHGHLALLVTDKNNHDFYQLNKDSFFTPASITKLFTATAALLKLKPNFQYQTAIYTTGSIVNGALNGNVYIRFTGDPTLTSQMLNALISTLAKRGITSINGCLC